MYDQVVSFVWLLAYCALQLSLTPVLSGKGIARIEGNLASGICESLTKFSKSGQVQEPLRNGNEYSNKLSDGKGLKWSKCNQNCQKFTLTDIPGQNDPQGQQPGKRKGQVQGQGQKSSNSTAKSQSRIYGGHDTVWEECPWVVRIKLLNSGSEIHCTATILNEFYILTAAHCIEESKMDDYEIWAAYYKISNQIPYRQYRKIFRIIYHDNYYPLKDSFEYDIVLLELDEPLKWTRTVQPADIIFTEPKRYRSGVATGWGHNEDQDFKNVLQITTLKIMDLDACKNERYGLVTDNNLCVGGIAGHGTCKGDDGGGFMIPGKEPMLAGIILTRYGCGDVVGSTTILLNVYKFIDWINGNMLDLQVNSEDQFFGDTGDLGSLG